MHNFVASEHFYMYYFKLPYLTMYFRNEKHPVFYVASRGHHADIGGITPGSMPPHSTSIHEEGAVFLSFKLVSQGVFQVFCSYARVNQYSQLFIPFSGKF